MDFLDPKKRRAHAIRLMTGYVLLGIAILLGTLVLLYQANGFDVRQGKIIQNGLIFVSSRPGGASIYLNNQLRDHTGARLVLPAGTYTMQLRRTGYDNWQRAVSVEGNSVEHYDYPFLIPQQLVTGALANYTAASPLSFQTPDRRWLFVERPEALGDFDLYDLKTPKKVAQSVTRVSLPADLLNTSSTPGSLQLVESSNDNQHILLQHTYGDNQSEYILLDRQHPEQSLNLTNQLQIPVGATLSLANKKYDHYFVYDGSNQTLSIEVLNHADQTKVLASKVLAYKTYGTDMVLYATPAANPTQADIILSQGGKTYKLRTVNADTQYLLDLAQYDGDWFVVAGTRNENRVYVYEDPVDALNKQPQEPLVPKDVLKIDQPDYVKFSANTQFIMVENGSSFAVYDADADKHYVYDTDYALDAAQIHADWMDGDRIMYVSQGKLLEFDYDGTNRRLLSGAIPAGAYFDRDYKYLYTLAPPSAVTKPATTAQQVLTGTSLLTPADQ